jgi:energy-coupling factor transport system ATP-binding protein
MVVVEKLTHVYQKGTPLERKALQDVSLEIAKGECVGIIGETGSGKTTLIQHFNGLLKPSFGRVTIDGLELGRSPGALAELRRRVGLVFQYPEHQLFEATVFEDISFVLRQRRSMSPEEIEQRVKWACGWVGLDYEEFRGRPLWELSGGEMRRVALAGILIQDPQLLLLDEPTVGLDASGKKEILNEIGKWSQSGKTVVIVSHSVEDLLDLVNRLIVLQQGKLVIAGTPAEVFAHLSKADELTFLIPSIYQLCYTLRLEGWEIPETTLQVEEALPILDRLLKRKIVSSASGSKLQN